MARRRTSRWLSLLLRPARRGPFLGLFVLLLVSNASGSFFNIAYNQSLIVGRLMDEGQQRAFQDVAMPLYNVVAYPICLGLMVYLFWPLRRCLRELRAGREVPPARLAWCRRRLVNLPAYQVLLNALGWLPGAVFFPLLVCRLGGPHEAGAIWGQFLISFLISTLLTTAQTFFLVEGYLMAVLYPDFFQDARPAEAGGWYFSFAARLTGMWLAVAVAPLAALLVVVNVGSGDLAGGVFVVGVLSGGLICLVVGSQLLGWIRAHAGATDAIALGRFDTRIEEKRPDEWGRLTDRFNDMAADLARGQQVRDTLGQMVSPRVRDELLPRYRALGGEVQDITVLFADIRGFTPRSAGEAPERVVALLNRFLTLSVKAVEDRHGWVNKFLGDGFMALFNVSELRADHADLAVRAALELQARLEDLNHDLAAAGQPGLVVGVGIHSGPALVGCIGATLCLEGGHQLIRKELTAIGETINLGQRIEQLTKTCGGPVLLSAETRSRLKREVPLDDLGLHQVPGCPEAVRIYRAATQPISASSSVLP